MKTLTAKILGATLCCLSLVSVAQFDKVSTSKLKEYRGKALLDGHYSCVFDIDEELEARMRKEMECGQSQMDMPKNKSLITAWIKDNITKRDLSKFKSIVQQLYKERLNDLEELTAEIALAKPCELCYVSNVIKKVNMFYTGRYRYSGGYWDTLPKYDMVFELWMDYCVGQLEECVSKSYLANKSYYQERIHQFNLKHYRWRTPEGVAEAARAEDARRRQEEIEEEKRRFEAELDIERQRVRAIEDQNAILNDIRWSIDNQPPPINNTYIVTPPPRRRWR